jgi:hypothetical protein
MILKNILLEKGCSFGKFLIELSITLPSNKIINYYITPFVTKSKKNMLIISFFAEYDFSEFQSIIPSITFDISSKYNIDIRDYQFILHCSTGFNSPDKYFLIDLNKDFLLIYLSFDDFINLIS